MHENIESLFYRNRKLQKKGLIAFLNAGDPLIDVSKDILHAMKDNHVDAVELCVPFCNSVTDGQVIRRSHDRALANKTTLEEVLKLVRWSNDNVGIPIILLADYSYTVRPKTIASFLNSCANYGVNATLIHGLPPRARQAYFDISRELEIETVLSFYLQSMPSLRATTYKDAQGFVYVVSKYGRSGSTIEFDRQMALKLKEIRNETTLPLAVGFGIKTNQHMDIVYNAGFDACVIGSSITRVIEDNISQTSTIPRAIDQYLKQLYCKYSPVTSRYDHKLEFGR